MMPIWAIGSGYRLAIGELPEKGPVTYRYGITCRIKGEVQLFGRVCEYYNILN